MRRAILVIDDDVDYLSLLRQFSKSRGLICQVDAQSSDSRQRPPRSRQSLPAPSIRGVGSFREIEQKDAWTATPIVILSKFSNLYPMGSSMIKGIKLFVLKQLGRNFVTHSLKQTLKAA